jgi:RecB family exonuclease
MEDLYRGLEGKRDPMKDIKALQKRDIVERAVDKTIANILFNDKEVQTDDFSGDTLLVRDIIVKYILRGILQYDAAREGFTINKVESDILYNYPTSSGLNVKLSGRADRIDTLSDGTIQIIDYKSGNKPHLEFDDMHSLFHGKAVQRISNIFQTFLYSMILHKTQGVDTRPSLFYASKMLNEEYSPLITMKANDDMSIEYYSLIAEEFESELDATLNELFDPTVPFRQAEDVDACKYCDYNRICRR